MLWKHAEIRYNFESIRHRQESIIIYYVTQKRKFRQSENEKMLTLASQLNPATATARIKNAVMRPIIRTSFASSTINKSWDCKQNKILSYILNDLHRFPSLTNFLLLRSWPSAYLGGSGFEPPKWIGSCYKSLIMHKNMPKINYKPPQSKISKTNLATSLRLTFTSFWYSIYT